MADREDHIQKLVGVRSVVAKPVKVNNAAICRQAR